MRAGAKVTLSLRVTAIRNDGYHEIDAIAVYCDSPFDELVIDSAGDSFEVESDGVAPMDDTNLVVRALRALNVTAGVTLRKHIPTQAGLGGGSSDAAAILRHFAGSRTDAEMVALGARLGADVPVCYAQRAARMRGIGEVLDFIELPSPLSLLIATPEFGCATPAVYRAYDELSPHQRIGRELPTPPGWGSIVTSLRNDLEHAAFAVEPRLAHFRADLERVTSRDAILCGSGSSYAVWFEDDQQAADAAMNVRAAMPGLRLVTSTRCR